MFYGTVPSNRLSDLLCKQVFRLRYENDNSIVLSQHVNEACGHIDSIVRRRINRLWIQQSALCFYDTTRGLAMRE